MTKASKVEANLNHETWDIDKLIPYVNNPRINDHAVDQLAAAIKEFGFKIPVIAKSDGTIVDGHLRYKAAKKLKLKKVPVILADDLTEAQIKAFRISVNKMSEMDSLKAMDFDLSLTGFTLDEISDLQLEINTSYTNSDSSTESSYTKKIAIPIYEPKGEKPNLKDLYDLTKAESLIAEINKSNLPEDEKKFLRFAAFRHIVFNYQNIAEYYSHAEAEVQELFENSALVIIDFNKAIENGFVVLSKELAEAYTND
jgi:hypothetical protein